jgi:glycosyltransferase involved in cell wall biosynthesis
MFRTAEPAADAANAARFGRVPVPSSRPSLRLLTFLYSFAPGGVERVAARLHAAWTAAGVDARIVLADDRVAPPRPLCNVGTIGAAPRHGGFARFVALARGLPALVAAQRPDILFCAGNTYTSLAVVLRLALGPACPPIVAKISNCLVRPDMTPPLRFFYGIWLRFQGRYIDHFVGLAPAMRDEIAQRIGVPQERISVIADPALCADDLARLASARDDAVRDRPGRHYLSIGRLAPQKNFALLLEAFARIAAPEDTLTILGDGPERPALERLAVSLGITRAVHLPGHVEPLDRWLAEADMFVLSSDYEGVPAVVIEALAAGLRIVATDCCVSMRALLGDGALGRIVPTGDAPALAQAMRTTDRDDGVVAARRAAAAIFTIEHAADAYLVLMRRLASARAAPRMVETAYPETLPLAAR